jgi:hypothetical protein
MFVTRRLIFKQYLKDMKAKAKRDKDNAGKDSSSLKHASKLTSGTINVNPICSCFVSSSSSTKEHDRDCEYTLKWDYDVK